MNSSGTELVEVKHEEEKKVVPRISEFPEFAEICCFMHHFGDKLGISLTFPRIARLLSCETDADFQSLTTLLVKLLNKMHHRSQLNRWQPALGRFLQRQAYNCDELREIGDALSNGDPSALFFSLPSEKRLRVLLFCLEIQFQLNVPFKEKIKSIDTPTLRSPPLGFDIFGNSYWLLVDSECNFLLYRSEAIKMTLELLADTLPALRNVLADLKDEKYEKVPISDLYTPFRSSFPNPESVFESVKLSLPELEPPLSPEKINVDEIKAISQVKQEVSEQLVGLIVNEAKVKELSENPNAELDSRKDEHIGEQHEPGKLPSIVPVVTTEEAQASAIPQKQDQMEGSIQGETLGLRRSSRKRKPVEFLKIETFSPKYRSKKSTQPSPQPTKEEQKLKKKEKKSMKGKFHKCKSSKRPRSSKKKKYRNGHNGNGACLWTRSPEDSEESENDEEEDLWEEAAEALGENSDSSLLEKQKRLPYDWLENIESDFDEGSAGSDEDIITGRNLQRRQNAEVLDEAPCQICTISNHPEWLLLCDSCDLGYHAQCLRPALHYIPPGDWFCPRCLHTRLVTALSEQLESLIVKSKKFDSAARMQERLNFVNISVSNILRDERTRQRNESSSTSSSSSEDEDGSRRPRQKRPRYYESDVSTSSSISGSEQTENESEEEEPEVIPVRSTRHKNIRYDVNAAFQELDEVLVEDEKYALEKLERSKAKTIHSEEGQENDREQNYVPSERPPLPPLITRKVKKRAFSSSSSSKSDALGSDGEGKKRRIRRPSSGSEEFRPSNESVTDEEDSEFGEVPEEDSNGNCSESVSSDQSWRMGGGRRGRRKRSKFGFGGRGSKCRSKYRRIGIGRSRSGRRIPRFEGPSSDDEIPVRRSARVRINYREIDSSEEEEVETKKKRRSSESEYAPSQEEEEEQGRKSPSAAEVEEEKIKEGEEWKAEHGLEDEKVENRKPLLSVPPVQTITVPEVHEIPQGIATDFPLPAELELDESELQIDEELMKGDDTIFQDLLMADINLPMSQEPPGSEGGPVEGPSQL
nr:remodeling and spacing factor 1 [Hymenolepis microstoma]